MVVLMVVAAAVVARVVVVEHVRRVIHKGCHVLIMFYLSSYVPSLERYLRISSIVLYGPSMMPRSSIK